MPLARGIDARKMRNRVKWHVVANALVHVSWYGWVSVWSSIPNAVKSTPAVTLIMKLWIRVRKAVRARRRRHSTTSKYLSRRETEWLLMSE